jgi:hypothetical protein
MAIENEASKIIISFIVGSDGNRSSGSNFTTYYSRLRELVSPLNGNNVTIEGIVVGDFQDGLGTHGNFKRFFFVQEEDSDADTDSNSAKEFLYMTEELPINVAVE